MRFLLGMVRHSSPIRYDSHQPTWATPSIAINWQPYVEKMLEIIDAEPLLRNAASAERHGDAPQRDDRPLTKLENLDLKLGHGMRDLAFKRI